MKERANNKGRANNKVAIKKKKKRNHGTANWAEFKRLVNIGHAKFFERRGMRPPHGDMGSCIENAYRASIQNKAQRIRKENVLSEKEN